MSEKVFSEVSPANLKRVAVVAVHGVGQHESGVTAQAVTDLLAGVESGGKTAQQNRYSSFGLRQVQISLAPSPRVNEEAMRNKLRLSSAIFEERRGVFRDLHTWNAWFHRKGESGKHAEERRALVRKMDIATEFMAVQLNEFARGDSENTYTASRRDGQRLTPDGTPEADVHVYEMYWADLARPNNSFVRVVFSLYQLLLHLTSLGRIALDHASIENIGKWDWFLYSRSYTYATRTLTLAVLPLLVLIYGIALAPLPLRIPGDPARAILGGGLLCLFGLLNVVLLGLRLKPPLGSKTWWSWIVPSILPGAALIWFLFRHPSASPLVLVLEWWTFGASVFYSIFLQYDQVRSGAKETGAFFIWIVTMAFFAILYSRGMYDAIALATTSILLVQYVFLLLRILVVLFILLATFAFLMECVCRTRLFFQKDKQQAQARARAAARTARIAIAVPTFLILLLGAFTGSAAYKFSSTRAGLYKEARAETIRLPNGTNFMVLSAEDTKSLLEHVQTFQAAPEPGNKPTSTKSIPDTGINSTTPAVTADQLLEGLILQSAPPGLTVTIGIVIIGFALFWLIVFPSSWYEFLPMRASANMSARLLGNWVSAGFRHLKLGINIIWAAVFLVPLLSLIVGIGYYAHAKPRGTFLLFFYTTSLMDIDGKLLIWVGGIILTAALGGTLLKFLARIFEVDTSAVLGTILDVDNYLRTSPASSTPRAHIVERYTALLRHIHTARKEDGSRSYDHIVIVAHSLGSLITADLFRFLHSNRDHHLVEFTFGGLHSERLPIYLFSMGCPVRQLLSRFFPHLYQWIREIPEDTGFPIPASEPGKPIPAGESPSPSDLGVKQWVNFYRSGDYVGRSVWINGVTSRTSGGLDDGEYPVPPEPTIYCDTSDPSRATRIDACIGPGAHTHYWDGTAPDVGVQLDKLIAL